MAWPKGSLQYLIKKVATGQKLSKHLEEQEAYDMLGRILEGKTTPMQTGAFFAAMRMKGESPEELAGFTQAVREHSHLVSSKVPYLVDLGYPYDGKVRTNILIVGAAFVAAGAGVSVMLHGARHVPPKRGRSPEEVLEAMGIPVDLEPGEVEAFIQKTGIGYLSCRKFSPAVANLLEFPAEVGVRSPLSAVHKLMNPTHAPVTVLGITHPPYLASMSGALALLHAKGWVVKGIEGTMELSLSHPTTVVEVKEGQCETSVIDPRAYGLPEVQDEAFAQRSLEENTGETLKTLEGKVSSWEELFILNAAFLIVASGKRSSMQEALSIAEESLKKGDALRVLERARQTVARL
ncbi:MAG: anthranilate phosphoribosyltransferase [Candidatus Omnitrophica bacterium]|nr:anthranilate phosphoribosyltransferase [Candidatus Omnitrophota bacterium]